MRRDRRFRGGLLVGSLIAIAAAACGGASSPGDSSFASDPPHDDAMGHSQNDMPAPDPEPASAPAEAPPVTDAPPTDAPPADGPGAAPAGDGATTPAEGAQ